MDAGVAGARRGGVQRGGDDAEATAESVGLPVTDSTPFDRISVSLWVVTTAPINLVVRAVIPTYLL